MPARKMMRALRRTLDRLGSAGHYEQCDVFGRRLELKAGTFRHTPDYDDAWFLACAEHSSHIFDIGANVGYDAVLALIAGPIEHIALVEANPQALAVAADNLIRNHLSLNARFIPAFAGDCDDDKVTFWTTGAGAAGSMSAGHALTASSRGDSIEVPTLTVDTLCKRLAVSPDFVKIDVEGAEALVLDGSTALVAEQRTRFLVEMHDIPDLSMSANTQRVLDWCLKTEYSAWYLKEHVQLDAPEPIAHRGRCHLLLQPAAWEYPQWLRGIEQSAPLSRALPDSG